MPKVSVIVPNYNHAPYLKRRIDSILNQTFQDMEVILLDDCSTDNSREILQLYAGHPKVTHLLLNEVNTRIPSKQWRKGLAQAKGEWIWIAESDDYCEATFLESQLELVNRSDKEIALVVCASHFVDIHDTIYSDTYGLNDMHSLCKGSDSYLFDRPTFYKKYLSIVNHVYNASAVIFRKDKVAEEVNVMERYSSSGDWLFWSFVVSKSEALQYNDKRLNYFRRIPGSITFSNQDLSRRESVQILFEQHRLGLNASKWEAAKLAANWMAKLHPYSPVPAKFRDLKGIFQCRNSLSEKVLVLFSCFLLHVKLRLK